MPDSAAHEQASLTGRPLPLDELRRCLAAHLTTGPRKGYFECKQSGLGNSTVAEARSTERDGSAQPRRTLLGLLVFAAVGVFHFHLGDAIEILDLIGDLLFGLLAHQGQ